MTKDESKFLPDSSWIRRFPPDLATVVLLVLLTPIAVLAPVVSETPLRFALVFPFLLFLPGYVLVSVLFPRTARIEPDSTSEITPLAPFRSGIGGFERVALSVGTSVAVNSMIGFLLNFTPWGIRFVPILVGICLFTVITAVVAAVRRLKVPPGERFRSRSGTGPTGFVGRCSTRTPDSTSF